MKNKQIYDVIISGAGPVGLFLACELALRRCSVMILEKAESPDSPLKKIPFGIRGLSAPTVEALDRRGLLGELNLHRQMKPHGTDQGPRRQGGHFAGIPFLDSHIDTSKWKYRLPSSTPANLVSTMEEIETILTRRALSLGVVINRGLALTHFHETKNDVTVQADRHVFTTQWLVGCDGARSSVRKQAGFEFAGTEPEFTGYSILVDLADSDKLKLGRNVTATGMYMQSQPGYIIIQDFDGGAFHDSRLPITSEHLQEVLRRVSQTEATITNLHTATTWTDRARQASKYRKGRVLLAGDAAHIHAPLGGQGLNLGLGDAMNLGWKLAAALQGNAPAGLLDSYEGERHPVGQQILDWSRAQVAVMRPTPEGRALNALFRDIINTRDGATYFAGKVWGIDMHYDLGGDHPLVGHSVPNFEFNNGAKIADFMHEGRGLLIDFEHRSFLQNLATRYGGQLSYVSGQAQNALALKAALVRPDGVIAWASESENEDPSLIESLELYFNES